jgi:hypothetical protein
MSGLPWRTTITATGGKQTSPERVQSTSREPRSKIVVISLASRFKSATKIFHKKA